MSEAQRKRLVMNKYQVRPVSWLSHYLKQDRYKVTTGIWKFVTTPNDPYYYAPSAAAIGRKPAGELIGFRTWQDATIAGYRPDPRTKPAPGAQLAQMGRLSRGPMLPRYIEYVYNGHVRPDIFAYNYNYVMGVANTVMRYPHTRPHVGVTVNQAIGATMGEASPPVSVDANGLGGSTTATTTTTVQGMPNAGGTRPMDVGGDKRVEDFDRTKSNFANLKR